MGVNIKFLYRVVFAAGVLVYLLMAVILLWKPEGLFRLG